MIMQTSSSSSTIDAVSREMQPPFRYALTSGGNLGCCGTVDPPLVLGERRREVIL
jgi:hypothetical protein